MEEVRSVKLRYSSAAFAHISHVYDYISGKNPVAATRVIGRIRSAAERLIDHPEMGRVGLVSGTREWVVTGLPYIIVYEVRPELEEIIVLGIYHGAQLRPGQTHGDD